MRIKIGEWIQYAISSDNLDKQPVSEREDYLMWNPQYIEELEKRNAEAKKGGGKERIEIQHSKGKLSVWERIDYLFDKDSFQEVGSLVESRFTDFGMDHLLIQEMQLSAILT